MSTPAGLSAKPCVDAIVAGDGHEVFALTSAGSLHDVAGRCVALEAGKVEFRQRSTVGGVWGMTTLNSLTPKLATCKTKVSLGSGTPATSAMAFASNHAVGCAPTPGVADKIGAQFGVAHSQLSLLIGESAKALDAVHNAAN